MMILNKQGFSLIQVLVVVVIVAILALFLTQMAKENRNLQDTQLVETEIMGYMDQVSALLSRKETCQATFNIPIPIYPVANLTETGTRIRSVFIVNENGVNSPLLTAGDDVAATPRYGKSRLRVDRIEIKLLTANLASSGAGKATMEITFVKPPRGDTETRNYYGAQTVKKSVDFVGVFSNEKYYWSLLTGVSCNSSDAAVRTQCLNDFGASDPTKLKLEEVTGLENIGNAPSDPNDYCLLKCTSTDPDTPLFIQQCGG